MSDAPPILQKIDFNDAPTWVRWSHSGTKLLHGYLRSMAVYIRSAKSGERIARLHCQGIPVFGDWSHDDAYISVVEGGRVTIRDARTGDIRRDREALITKFAVWHPREHIIAMDHGDAVLMFDAMTTTGLASHLFRGSFVTAIWQDDSTLLVGQANTVSAMDRWGYVRTILDTGNLRAIAAAHGLIAVADGNTAVVLDDDGDVRAELRHSISTITSMSLSHDGSLLAVLRKNGSVELWSTRTWNFTQWKTGAAEHNALAFSPTELTLALTAERSIVFYDISSLVATARSIRYTTAKIALVGDSGAGKTGLGWVLTHDAYKEHESTHGEEFWVAERLSTTRADGTRCEAVVWDLAGQPDYRLIHSLFIDDADVALVVFDPTEDPLKGPEFWLRALHASKEKRCRTILVAGRVDRGTGILSEEELTAFVRKHDIPGGFIATSAKTGEGVEELTRRIAGLIDWDSRPATVTIDTFKQIRDRVLELKEQQSPDVLWTVERLQEWLRGTTGVTQSVEDITTAVKHLSDHGYVRLLRSGTGGQFVLLSPDLLNNLAASIILEARRNPKGLGALDERRLLGGAYEFPQTEKLSPRDREILLDAATTLFIERNVCFRETLGTDTFLIFPSLINQNKPPIEDVPVVEGTSYSATGATENVYASLVVLLGYTNTFTRTNQWRNQAQYEMGADQICGFRLTDEREGQIELVLYFGERAEPATRQLFQGLFEKFLLSRRVEVQIFPPMRCAACDYTQPRSEVIKRQRDGAKQMFCPNCGGRIALPERILAASTAPAVAEAVEGERQTAVRRTQFEKAITGLKSYLRDVDPEAAPSCFISYAWGDPAEERWVERQLATDLRNAGVDVILDRWHSRPGTNIARFIERIDSADFVVLVGTPRLKRKYKSTASDPVVAAELKLINQRLTLRESESERVIPLLRKGRASTAFPPLVNTSVHVDFRDDDHYFARIFDLLLTLYGISFEDQAMRDLRDAVAAGPA